MKLIVGSLIALATLFAILYAVPKLESKATNSESVNIIPGKLRTPEEELAGFKLADGFVIELVASEREGVINPIDLSFDDEGRLWTQTAKMYPLDPVADAQWDDLMRLMDDIDAQKKDSNFTRILDLYQGKTKGVDKILVLTNLYDHKSPVKSTVWADSLAIPMSILPYKDGVYVVQGSELFFLNDADKDGKADQRIPMFTGFGFVDTHTMAHALIRGPGDWIYFSHGALNKGKVTSLQSDAKLNLNYSKIGRFSLDAKKIELVSSGLNNIWGFQMRDNGQWYGCEANDLGYSIVPMEPGTGFPGIGNDRLHAYQPFMPELHKFRVGGTGISGLAFADDASGSFPPEWKNVALLANPITSTINAVKIERNPDGTVSARHLSDLLTSEDAYFRPVNMEFGPDGCLYVADWYDKIISHNEVSRNDPDRDKSYGRIWRIRHVNQKPYPIPDFNTVKTEALVDYLKSPSLWMKRSAWHQITDRAPEETSKLAPTLVALAGDTSRDEVTRIHALWSLEGIKHYDAGLMGSLLNAREHNLRREAVRALTTFSPGPQQTAMALSGLANDPNPMVRSQLLRTLADLGTADTSTIDLLVRASKPELAGNEMGGAYERKFERYLALKALEQYPQYLQKFMNTRSASLVPATNMLWAIQALPDDIKKKEFLRLWPLAGISRLDESTFIMISRMLADKTIYAMVKPLIQDSSNAVTNLTTALKNQQQVQSPYLSSLLEIPVKILLKSNLEVNRQLAVDAIGRMNIKTKKDALVSLVNDKTSSATLLLVLKAFEHNARANQNNFIKVLQNKNFEFDVRLTALHSLAKTDPMAALQQLQPWIPKFSMDQKKTLVAGLSGSTQGAGVLLHFFQKKLIDTRSFTVSTAERVYNAGPENILAKNILAEAKEQAALEKTAFISRRNKYLAIVEKQSGNVEKGKVLFQNTCLLCHKVGEKGQDIAPALDGSSTRGTAALLTAILDPDAAVEGGYAIYRITRNDNSTLEGYLYNKDDRGTTIAFMGGSKVFTESSNIKSQGFLAGRSFMPKGLINRFTDGEVADLFAYFRTLH